MQSLALRSETSSFSSYCFLAPASFRSLFLPPSSEKGRLTFFVYKEAGGMRFETWAVLGADVYSKGPRSAIESASLIVLDCAKVSLDSFDSLSIGRN